MPRCYVFKRWKDSLFGLLILFLGIFWLSQGPRLATHGYPFWIAAMPLPVVLIGLYMSVGRLLKARLRWEQIFYAISNQRVLLFNRGKVAALPLAEITYFRCQRLGAELGSVEIFAGTLERCLTLECIEYPRMATDLLESAVRTPKHPLTAAAANAESY